MQGACGRRCKANTDLQHDCYKRSGTCSRIIVLVTAGGQGCSNSSHLYVRREDQRTCAQQPQHPLLCRTRQRSGAHFGASAAAEGSTPYQGLAVSGCVWQRDNTASVDEARAEGQAARQPCWTTSRACSANLEAFCSTCFTKDVTCSLILSTGPV